MRTRQVVPKRKHPLNRASSLKRVLVLTTTFPRWQKDDEPPFVYELCRRLTNKFDIKVLAPHVQGALCEELMEGIKVKRFRYFYEPMQNLCYHGGILANLKESRWRCGLIPFFFIAEVLNIYKVIRKDKINLIHAHWILPQGLAALFACLVANRKIPVLCTSHGGDLYGLRGVLFSWLKKYVISQSSAFTVVSQAMRYKILSFGIQNRPIHVIPMGVDLKKRFVPYSESKKNTFAQLLFVGRLVPKKGIEYLIAALPDIIKKYPGAILTIIGEGQERPLLEKQIEKLGIRKNVIFLGAIRNDKVFEFYQAADIVLFPSIIADDGDREGFGLVLVEALGCGCAVVVTDLPAMKDIIIDGHTGIVVPQKNSRKMAEKVVKILNNPELGRSLGKNGRKYVLERFDWDIIAMKYVKLIKLMS